MTMLCPQEKDERMTVTRQVSRGPGEIFLQIIKTTLLCSMKLFENKLVY